MGPNLKWVNVFDVMLHVGIFTLVDCLLSLSLSLCPFLFLSLTLSSIAYLPTGHIGSKPGGEE